MHVIECVGFDSTTPTGSLGTPGTWGTLGTPGNPGPSGTPGTPGTSRRSGTPGAPGTLGLAKSVLLCSMYVFTYQYVPYPRQTNVQGVSLGR